VNFFSRLDVASGDGDGRLGVVVEGEGGVEGDKLAADVESGIGDEPRES
jgi:hypothetical protein